MGTQGSSLHDERTVQPVSTHARETWATVGLTVLWHPDPSRVGQVAPLFDLVRGGEAPLARFEPVFQTVGGEATESLGTPYLSRTPLRLIGKDASVRLEVPARSTHVLAQGREVSGIRSFDAKELSQGVVLELGKTIVLLLHVLPPPAPKDPLGSVEGGPQQDAGCGLLGESAAMRRLHQDALRAAESRAPVLLRGESGVGKELLARAIHTASARASRAYVCVNMAAIAPQMAPSLLFGHTKGAFTGAERPHQGYFPQAEGGTLFLDEIGDTPLSVQPLLLRAIEGEIQVLGEPRPRRVEVRIIAATDLDLEEAVDRGDFRYQLQERLSGFEITVPPLRARREDIGRLFVHFLRAELEEAGRAELLRPPSAGDRPWFRARVMAELARHDWPGNVRQLRNVARQIALSNRDRDTFDLDPRVERLLASVRQAPSAGAVGSRPEVETARPGEGAAGPDEECLAGTAKRSAMELTEEEILAALRSEAFNVAKTAARLGVSRSWLFTRMDGSSKIRKARDLGATETTEALAACRGDLRAAAMRLEVSLHGLKQRLTELGLSAKARR